MYHPFLVGERIYFRGIEKKDLETNYFQWFNDAEVTRYMYHGAYPNSLKKMEAFYDQVQSGDTDVVFAIILKQGDRHIGNTGLHGIDWVNRKAEFGIIIGEKDVWGNGYGTDATGLILAYAFNHLNLHRVHLGVHAEHKGAIRAYEKAGFRQEGHLRDEFLSNGTYSDRIIMGILREEFQSMEHSNAQ